MKKKLLYAFQFTLLIGVWRLFKSGNFLDNVLQYIFLSIVTTPIVYGVFEVIRWFIRNKLKWKEVDK